MVSGDKPKSDNAVAKLALQGWVSLSAFSSIVGISYPTAIRLANEGKVQTVQVGGVRRVYRSEVERFLKSGNYVEN